LTSLFWSIPNPVYYLF